MNRARLRDALQQLIDGKQNAPKEIPGLLGTYISGVQTVAVAGRAGYVWVRLRGSQSDLVVAYNDAVLEQYGLAVKVEQDTKDPTIYKIIGRDVDLYRNWGNQPLKNHGTQHGFRQGDTVWVAFEQITPLMLRPTDPVSMAAYVERGRYAYGTDTIWWPGSGTTSFNNTNVGLLTGTPNDGAYITVYMDMDTRSLGYLTGTTFDYVFELDDYLHISFPTGTNQLALGAILIRSDALSVGWDDFVDLRPIISRPKP